MGDEFFERDRTSGSLDLSLPDELRDPVRNHLESLRALYRELSWGRAVGFGDRPALLVIDLALFWTRQDTQMGSNLDSVVESTRRLLDAARATDVPVIFTTFDPHPIGSRDTGRRKVQLLVPAGDDAFRLDPRLGRLPTERVIFKRAASGFRDTDLDAILSALDVDTLIVTGASTSHCVYATCRDASSNYRVIVPREAVGDRCEIMHLVNLLDIDIDIGDVVPTDSVVAWLNTLGGSRNASALS